MSDRQDSKMHRLRLCQTTWTCCHEYKRASHISWEVVPQWEIYTVIYGVTVNPSERCIITQLAPP